MSTERYSQAKSIDLPAKALWDPTHASDTSAYHWTTTNVGEAVPGVLTPLALAHWGLRGHLVGARLGYDLGVMSARERDDIPAEPDRILRCFYGRLTVKLEHITNLGDRMPGVTGEEMMVSLFGKAPASLRFHPTVRRYPFIALRMTRTALRIQPRLRAMCAETDTWWREKVQQIPHLDLPETLAVLHESLDRYLEANTTHTLAMFTSFQLLFDMLARLIASTGVGDLSVLSGTGGAETAVVGDLWLASRGQLSLDQVVANHGFHGPNEGEVSSTVWREDPSPLEKVIAHYRGVPDTEAPDVKERDKQRRRVDMTREVLASVPRSHRPMTRLILKLARERIPDRGRGKRAFLQAIDVTRMAARRAGDHWVTQGGLDDRDDVFYLTDQELLRPLPRDVKELVSKRRERRRLYQQFEFAEMTWAGMPDVRPISRSAETATTGTITGTGASAGIVEGTVRVVADPTFSDVEPGEILVATTTDPSWSAIMFVSAGLVTDLGGMLSHAAVVARELEIPCVVNTRDATSRLRSGDRVRVDGKSGTVEIISRAA